MSYQSVNVEQHLKTLIALSNVSGRRNTGLYMQQEIWRNQLQRDVLLQASSIKAIVTAERGKAEDATRKEHRCIECKEAKFARDVVRFECPPPKHKRNRADGAGATNSVGESSDGKEVMRHDFCVRCVSKFVKEQTRIQTQELHCPESEKVHRILRQKRPELHVLVCPLCHVPAVVEQSSKFQESLERDETIDSRLQYAVHLAATRLLRDNFYTDELQENQRRSFFGAFSGQNLLVWDLCGEYSDPRAQFSEIEPEDFHSRFQRPNGSWIWLETWTPRDWVYGERSFEELHQKITEGTADPAKHSKVSGVSCLVRTRRKMRTRIRMNDDVKDDFCQL